jgi:hypothetical protein
MPNGLRSSAALHAAVSHGEEAVAVAEEHARPRVLQQLLASSHVVKGLEDGIAAMLGPLAVAQFARGCGSRAAPVFGGNAGRARHGAGAPRGPARRRRSDARRTRGSLASWRGRADRGRDSPGQAPSAQARKDYAPLLCLSTSLAMRWWCVGVMPMIPRTFGG